MNNQYKVIIFYEVHIWSEQRYHSPCSTRTFFDGHEITHSCMSFVFMAQFIPPNPTQFVFFLHTVRIPAMTFLFLWKKERKSESHIDWIFRWLSVYRDLYSSSSSWLAAGNSHKEEPSSVLETCCQQHIFDDVVTLCSKNGKKSRKQRILECMTWYNSYCSYANITELLPHLMKASCFLIGRQVAGYGTN